MSHLSRRTLFQVSAGAALLPAMGVLRTASAEVVVQDVMTDAYSYFASNEQFTTWVRLIAAGGLEASARGATQFTVFAPTDNAFEKYPQVMDLLSYQTQVGKSGVNLFPDTSKIVKLVRSHVVLGKHFPKEATGGIMTATSLAGTPISVDTSKSPVTVTWSGATTGGPVTGDLTSQPVNTFNAVIYPVDTIYVASMG
jgi:uncharacterized surface protein with fasciclin (FAS1) repeats